MINRWFMLWALAMLLSGACQDKIPPAAVKKVEGLVAARQLFQQGLFAESAASFAACLQQQTGSGQEEARFGLLAAAFLAELPEWKNHAEKWPAATVYHWDGRSFSLADGISKNSADLLGARIGHDHPARGYFVLLHFLISQRRYETLPRLVAAMPENELAWDMTLASAWTQLRSGRYADGAELFSSMLVQTLDAPSPQLSPAQRQEAWWGRLVGNLVQQAEPKAPAIGKGQQPAGWQYSVERHDFDPFRAGTPLAAHRQVGQKLLDQGERQMMARVILIDLLFVLGSQASNRLDLWNKGLVLASQEASSPSVAEATALCQDLSRRFELAIAWDNWVSGRSEQARATFKFFATTPGAWQSEALLGLALLSWKEDAALQELPEKFPLVSWPNYCLAGREFSFYRLEARKQRTNDIDALIAKEPEHKTYLALFDALCLLGDGRAAYQLLGRVIAEYNDPASKAVYLAEQANVPKDVYAQNQLWEKMD